MVELLVKIARAVRSNVPYSAGPYTVERGHFRLHQYPRSKTSGLGRESNVDIII